MSDAVNWHSRIASDWDEKYRTSPAFRERYRIWKEMIDQYSKPEGRVLDVGCGSGVLSFLAGAKNGKVIGLDGSEEMLVLCRCKKEEMGCDNVRFLHAGLAGFDFEQLGMFDLILCSSVLEYLEDFWGTLKSMQNVLLPGGVLIFSVPNAASLYRRFEKTVYALTGWPHYFAHVRHVLKQAELCEAVQARGLEVLQAHYYAATPLFSPLCRILGKPAWADNLFLLVCRQPFS